MTMDEAPPEQWEFESLSEGSSHNSDGSSEGESEQGEASSLDARSAEIERWSSLSESEEEQMTSRNRDSADSRPPFWTASLAETAKPVQPDHSKAVKSLPKATAQTQLTNALALPTCPITTAPSKPLSVSQSGFRLLPKLFNFQASQAMAAGLQNQPTDLPKHPILPFTKGSLPHDSNASSKQATSQQRSMGQPHMHLPAWGRQCKRAKFSAAEDSKASAATQDAGSAGASNSSQHTAPRDVFSAADQSKHTHPADNLLGKGGSDHLKDSLLVQDVQDDDLPWHWDGELGLAIEPDANELSDAICRRTRARNPMKEVTIEELEAQLVDDLADPMYDDDETYQAFLSAFNDPMDSLEANLLPEDDDDDRDFLLDPDALLLGDDEYLLPSLPSSPLQTRFGGGKSENLNMEMEPIDLEDDAYKSDIEQPVVQQDPARDSATNLTGQPGAHTLTGRSSFAVPTKQAVRQVRPNLLGYRPPTQQQPVMRPGYGTPAPSQPFRNFIAPLVGARPVQQNPGPYPGVGSYHPQRPYSRPPSQFQQGLRPQPGNNYQAQRPSSRPLSYFQSSSQPGLRTNGASALASQSAANPVSAGLASAQLNARQPFSQYMGHRPVQAASSRPITGAAYQGSAYPRPPILWANGSREQSFSRGAQGLHAQGAPSNWPPISRPLAPRGGPQQTWTSRPPYAGMPRAPTQSSAKEQPVRPQALRGQPVTLASDHTWAGSSSSAFKPLPAVPHSKDSEAQRPAYIPASATNPEHAPCSPSSQPFIHYHHHYYPRTATAYDQSYPALASDPTASYPQAVPAGLSGAMQQPGPRPTDPSLWSVQENLAQDESGAGVLAADPMRPETTMMAVAVVPIGPDQEPDQSATSPKPAKPPRRYTPRDPSLPKIKRPRASGYKRGPYKTKKRMAMNQPEDQEFADALEKHLTQKLPNTDPTDARPHPRRGRPPKYLFVEDVPSSEHSRMQGRGRLKHLQADDQ